MQQADFLDHFSACFHTTPPDQIRLNTRFRELEEWGSMMALIVLSMIDSEYNCLLTTEVFRKAETVDDLYRLVLESKK